MTLSVFLRPMKAIDYGYLVTFGFGSAKLLYLVLYCAEPGWFAVIVKDQYFG